MPRITNRQITENVAHRQTFDANSASARWDAYPGRGRLPQEWADQIRLDAEQARAHFGGDLYVVYSYGTPIAWWNPAAGETGAWTFPPVKYSVTTSRSQSYVRVAISVQAA